MFTQVAAVVAWTIWWNWSGLTPYDFGQRLYWLLPAVLVLLGIIGLFVFGRMPRQQRQEPWAFRLLWSSLFTFAPLGWYAFMAFIGLLIGDFE